MKPVFLKLFKGCYGKQRNGATVGPLVQDPQTGWIVAENDGWYPTGAFSSGGETTLDIIEILPAREKLPEPFEELFILKSFGGTQDYTHRNDGTVYRRKRRIFDVTAEILNFTGITKLDIPPDRVLENAKGKLSEVLLLGFKDDGTDYFAASKADAANSIYLCQRAIHRLMTVIDEADI